MNPRPLILFHFFLLNLLLNIRGDGQCPFTATLVGSNLACGSGSLTVSSGNQPVKIVWYKDGTAVNTGTAFNLPYNATAPGSYIAVITDASGCTATTNAVVIDAPSAVTIASATTTCPGASLSASSAASDLSQIQWYQDGQPVKTAIGSVATGSGTTVAGGNGYGSGDDQFEDPDGIL